MPAGRGGPGWDGYEIEWLSIAVQQNTRWCKGSRAEYIVTSTANGTLFGKSRQQLSLCRRARGPVDGFAGLETLRDGYEAENHRQESVAE